MTTGKIRDLATPERPVAGCPHAPACLNAALCLSARQQCAEPRLSEWCESGIAHVPGVDEEGEGGYIASGHSWCDLKGGCGCPCHAEAAADALASPF